jgi:predicted DNA-binding transcriptional regulator AlpA
LETVPLKFRTFEELKAAGDIQWTRDHTRRKCAAGEFPKPVVLSRDPNGKARRIAWIDEEIVAYKANLIAERDATSSVAE